MIVMVVPEDVFHLVKPLRHLVLFPPLLAFCARSLESIILSTAFGNARQLRNRCARYGTVHFACVDQNRRAPLRGRFLEPQFGIIKTSENPWMPLSIRTSRRKS